jgi:hypothetical protein
MAATADPRGRHEDAVLHAEARHIVRALAPFRVLHRDALEHVAGAERWQECSFERALAEAVRSGTIERLGEDFYRFVS